MHLIYSRVTYLLIFYWFLLGCLLPLHGNVFAAEEELLAGNQSNGAPMIAGVRKIENNRYATTASYEDVIEFYKKTFKGNTHIKMTRLIHFPALKAMHIANLSSYSNNTWQGLNIYTFKQETRIFVITNQ